MTTVPPSTRTTSYTLASASAGPFAVGFRIFDATLAVYVNDALRTDYTVSATFSGGYSDTASITFASALAIGDIIRIDGDMPVARGAEYLNPDPNLTTKINVEMARLWAAMQQLDRDVERANSQDLFQFKAADGSVNFEVEALETATAYWAAMGGTAPFGPTLYADGAAADISAQIVPKGSGGLVIGNALGRMLEVLSGVAGYIADRIIKIRPGLTGTSYASIDAEAGLDLKAGGDTILRLLDGAGAGTAHLEVAADGTGYVVVRPSSGDALVLAGNAGGLQVQGATLMARKTTVYSVATGGTVSPSAYDGDSVISPIGAPLASLTIRLPASPPDGAEVRVSSRGSVSSLTWTSLSGVPDPILSPPSSIGATTPVTLKFSTGYGWYKVA